MIFALKALGVLVAFAAVSLLGAVGLRWLIMVGLDGAYRRGIFRHPEPRRDQPKGADAAKVWRRMEALATPALLLVDAATPRFSKIGSDPDLPEGLAWPASGAPRAFLAQIDLAEIDVAGSPDWLPKLGRLYVFHRTEGAGLADDTVVLFTNNERETETAPPAGLGAKHRFSERRVSFETIRSLPSLDWLAADVRALDLTDDELDFLADAPMAALGKACLHQLGGYPAEIQDGQMQVECEYLARGLTRSYSEPPPEALVRASKQWRLLLQIDSDPALGMNWGDAGRLYVFIREKHARAGEFSKTVSLWQTY